MTVGLYDDKIGILTKSHHKEIGNNAVLHTIVLFIKKTTKPVFSDIKHITLLAKEKKRK